MVNLMETPQALLLDATCKLVELHDDPKWAAQLPTRCPPVLWFGNATSSKPKVLTLGANPSREEFLSDSSARAIERFVNPVINPCCLTWSRRTIVSEYSSEARRWRIF